jgi:hypothetical protein
MTTIENRSCIICGTDSGLDTELVITVDGQKITVKVCTEHADDITPKAAKAAYLKWKSERDTQMQEFLAQAAKLGMTVVPQGSGLVVATKDNTSRTTPNQTSPVDQQISSELRGSRQDGILPTSEVDSVMQGRVAGVSGSVDGTGIERHNAYNPNELESKLPDGARDGLVRMELAEGRHGTPLAIPALRQDGLGTTRVRIAKTMTDTELQRRFRQQANTSVNDESGAASHYFKDGYDIQRCPMCKGNGQIQKSQTETMICPKCNGSGML